MRIIFDRDSLDTPRKSVPLPGPSDAAHCDEIAPAPRRGETRGGAVFDHHSEAALLTGFIYDFLGHPGRCPRCEELLENREEIFVLSDGQSAFLAKNAAGWFCWNCPTVVVNGNFYDLLRLGYGDSPSGRGYALLGFCPDAELRDLQDSDYRRAKTLEFDKLAIDSVHPWTWFGRRHGDSAVSGHARRHEARLARRRRFRERHVSP